MPQPPQIAPLPDNLSEANRPLDWFSIAQFALSVLAILGLWLGAAIALGAGIIDLVGRASMNVALPGFLMAATAATSGLLLLPSAFFAFRRLMGHPPSQPGRLPWFLRATRLIFLFPVFLLIGYWVTAHTGLEWLVLPPVHILAIGLPIYFLIFLAIRKLPLGSAQRLWGVFGSGLVLGPALILICELVALLVYGIAAGIMIANQPELVRQINSLLQQMRFSNPTPEMVSQIFGPYLSHPVVILGVLSFVSFVVPLIEEALKPIGVWLLVGTRLTPAAGFAAGALSGGGYALFETLALTSNGEAWTYLVVARVGTAVIHILTAGLMGWALVSAWHKGSYVRLALIYVVAISLHGLWNGLTLMSSFSDLLAAQPGVVQLPVVTSLGNFAPYGLGVLTVGALLLILGVNWALQPEHGKPAGPQEMTRPTDEPPGLDL